MCGVGCGTSLGRFSSEQHKNKRNKHEKRGQHSYLPPSPVSPIAVAWASASTAVPPPPGAPKPASPCPRHARPSAPQVQATPRESTAMECSDPHAMCTMLRRRRELSLVAEIGGERSGRKGGD